MVSYDEKDIGDYIRTAVFFGERRLNYELSPTDIHASQLLIIVSAVRALPPNARKGIPYSDVELNVLELRAQASREVLEKNRLAADSAAEPVVSSSRIRLAKH